MLHSLICFIILCCCCINLHAQQQHHHHAKVNVTKLLSYNVNVGDTTVSGLSAGGYMAVQFHISHSKDIQGAAIFAGGPYGCAFGNVDVALTVCMKGLPTPPIPVESYQLIIDNAMAGLVDPVENLINSKVYLFSGTIDTVVYPIVMSALYDMYSLVSLKEKILFVTAVDAEHTQPTDFANHTNPCYVSEPPYISFCNYDGAGQALNYMLGPLNPPRKNATLTGRMIEFDQSEFFNGNPNSVSMSTSGFVYVPAACEQGQQCKLHISFHGCLQNYDSVGDAYINRAGYNEWADTNNIIVLYPQTIISPVFPYNPDGCFNWFDYHIDIDPMMYCTKEGIQIKGIRAMMDRIANVSNVTTTGSKLHFNNTSSIKK